MNKKLLIIPVLFTFAISIGNNSSNTNSKSNPFNNDNWHRVNNNKTVKNNNVITTNTKLNSNGYDTVYVNASATESGNTYKTITNAANGVNTGGTIILNSNINVSYGTGDIKKNVTVDLNSKIVNGSNYLTVYNSSVVTFKNGTITANNGTSALMMFGTGSINCENICFTGYNIAYGNVSGGSINLNTGCYTGSQVTSLTSRNGVCKLNISDGEYQFTRYDDTSKTPTSNFGTITGGRFKCSSSLISPMVPSNYTVQNCASKGTGWVEVVPNSYSITYLDKGGSSFSGTHESGYPTSHTYGTTTTLKSAVKTNHIFEGWYKEQDCSGTKVTSLDATEYESNITLYAKWKLDVSSPTITSAGGYFKKVSTKKQIVMFGVTFNDYAKLNSGDTCGIYVYSDEGSSLTASFSTTNISAVKAKEGRFYCVYGENQTIVDDAAYHAKGYIIVNGTTIYSPLISAKGNYDIEFSL